MTCFHMETIQIFRWTHGAWSHPHASQTPAPEASASARGTDQTTTLYYSWRLRAWRRDRAVVHLLQKWLEWPQKGTAGRHRGKLNHGGPEPEPPHLKENKRPRARRCPLFWPPRGALQIPAAAQCWQSSSSQWSTPLKKKKDLLLTFLIQVT